jgi:hypothetical protein
MSESLERLGLDIEGFFINANKEKVEAKVLGIAFVYDKQDFLEDVPEETNAYIIADNYNPTSNEFPIIYLKKL